MRDATKISDYFKGDKTLFIIPIYQRNYAWEEKHCERLFRDLERINRDGVRSHFFGSIVSTRASETEDDLLIIDGQQRITTLSLIVLAAMNAVKNGDIEGLSEEDMDSYCKLYLKASLRKVERKTKLVPIDNDIKAYDALFENKMEAFVPAEKSGVTRNYLLFYRRFMAGPNSHLLSFHLLMKQKTTPYTFCCTCLHDQMKYSYPSIRSASVY